MLDLVDSHIRIQDVVVPSEDPTSEYAFNPDRDVSAEDWMGMEQELAERVDQLGFLGAAQMAAAMRIINRDRTDKFLSTTEFADRESVRYVLSNSTNITDKNSTSRIGHLGVLYPDLLNEFFIKRPDQIHAFHNFILSDAKNVVPRYSYELAFPNTFPTSLLPPTYHEDQKQLIDDLIKKEYWPSVALYTSRYNVVVRGTPHVIKFTKDQWKLLNSVCSDRSVLPDNQEFWVFRAKVAMQLSFIAAEKITIDTSGVHLQYATGTLQEKESTPVLDKRAF